MSDTKAKLLLSQEWLTLENVSYFFNEEIYSTLQTCLLRSTSILYIQPKHLQFKENKSHRGFYQEFSKGYKYKDRLDYEHFYRIGRSSCIKTMTDDILGLEVSILQILSLYDESDGQEFEIKMIDYIGGKKTKYGKTFDENDDYGIAFCKPYIELDKCNINIFIKVTDFINHFKDILDLDQYLPKKQAQTETKQDTSYKYSKALKPYLDTNHHNYSSRLAMCIDIWNYLFLDDNYDKNVSIKENIKRWNKNTNQQLELSESLINAMQSILNFDNGVDRTGKMLKGYTPEMQKK